MRALRELPVEQRHEIFQRVRDDAIWSYRYLILLAMSSIIATFGLLANSAAVVIGAMIIAPLMGPILGLSLGMVRGSAMLERRSLLAEAMGAALVIVIAYLVGLLPFTLGISDEMLARTAPTTFDIAIALASGLAGAYASVNPKISSTLAGVAISVALVPPLASSGLLFAFGRPDLGFGAFLLWLANFLSIQLAAAAVYILYGFLRKDPSEPDEGRWKILRRFAPSFVALGLVGWFLTSTLVRLFEDHTVERRVRDVLSAQIAKRTGGRLDEILLLSREETGWSIVASALTPQPFDVAQVEQMQRVLSDAGIENPYLIVRSLVSQDVSSNGRVYVSPNEMEQREEASRQAAHLERLRAALRDSLAEHEGLELIDVERRQRDGLAQIHATVRAPTPVSPEEVRTAEEMLREGVEAGVSLVIRSITTRDADSSSFLFQPSDEQPDAELESLRERIAPVLERRLPGRFQGFALVRTERAITIRASVEASTPTPTEVIAALEADLRANVDPRLRLWVSTTLVVRGS